MIDTLGLMLTDYSIMRDNKLIIVPSPYEARSGKKTANFALWADEKTGEVYEGARAFCNGKRFKLTHLPLRGCFVNFSIPGVYHGVNLYPVGREGSKSVLTTIEADLGAVGVHTNIEEAKFCRLDSFRNVETEEPFPSYYPLLASLELNRTRKKDYGNTILWYNKQKEICIYDKIAEMSFKKLDVSAYPENTIRFEYRMLKAQKIRDALGLQKVKELWDNFGLIEENFVSVMKETLFHYEPIKVEALSQNKLQAELAIFKERYSGRYWLDNYLKAIGLSALLQQVDIETFTKAVTTICGNRMLIHRLVKKLMRAKMDSEMMESDSFSNKTLAQLYEELRSKVLYIQ